MAWALGPPGGPSECSADGLGVLPSVLLKGLRSLKDSAEGLGVLMKVMLSPLGSF